MKNAEYVRKHNERFEKDLETYELEMNSFADLTSQEFAAQHLGLQKNI